jgi:hypothetical protein
MRDVSGLSKPGALGPPIRPTAAPAPAPQRVAPGVMRDEQGRLYTDLPDPTSPPVPPGWPFNPNPGAR